MTSGNANYLIADRQGSIVATASPSGALLANYTYDPYGVPNTWGTVGTTPRFRYTGQAAIPEAGLYHYKARVYDPVFGRFFQTDPVGYGPDVNWYAYVGNDPVDGTDSPGTDPCTGSNLGGCGSGGLGTGVSGSSSFGAGHELPTSGTRTAAGGAVGNLVASIASGLKAADQAIAGAVSNNSASSLGDYANGVASELGGAALEGDIPDIPPAGKAVAEAEVGVKSAQEGVAAAGRAVEGAFDLHHAFPKYLGGPAEQTLVQLPRDIHQLYHGGLDRIAARWKGASYYGSLAEHEMSDVLRRVGQYTKDFDANFGTNLYDVAVSHGFPRQ